ncbi:hypothetical protein MMC28_005710 [Mycoblastus sanguinarius]|nr:hypothetical protein [Mycoblastus sanguinarius]
MPASYEKQVFGRQGAPNVQAPLPQPFEEPSRRCLVTTNTNGPSSSASWYEIYLAATAIDALCVRQGRAGLAINLGNGLSGGPGTLFVTIKDENPRSDVVATS